MSQSIYQGVRNRLARTARTIGLRRAKLQYASVGRYRLRLPLNSQLLNYKSAFRLYDTALGRIAAILKTKYPTLHAIDIGANVGDTAALIRESSEIPVLCIEGDPAVLPILAENVVGLGPGVEVEPNFVGPEDAGVDLWAATGVGHNTSLVGAIDPRGPVKLRSLKVILSDHPAFRSAKLLKTDTEGFDFDIIRQSVEFIRASKPVVFFEYNPHFRPDEPDAGLDTIETLIGVGYSEFIYYDNFGNFLVQCGSSDRTRFRDLDMYLASNRSHGVAVWYFDICALHRDDADLVPAVRSYTQVRSCKSLLQAQQRSAFSSGHAFTAESTN